MPLKTSRIFLAAVAFAAAQAVSAPGPESISVDSQALVELLPLALDAADVFVKASEREAKHRESLAKRGVAEVPPTQQQRYTIDAGGLGAPVFDDCGEIYIDRRFVTAEEMKVVKAIEGWIAKWFPSKIVRKKPSTTVGKSGLPVFRGFEAARYQMHDALIARLVKEFNRDKAKGCGGTASQAAGIADLTPALVKAHMIEEAGGNGPRSKAAWNVDPLQVNVPGDWGEEKLLVGLTRPEKRNEGSVEQNVRAAIRYLSRKGFSTAARPAADRPKSFFDGWKKALSRYNGRRDRTDTDRYYSDEYADKIVKRATYPDVFVPIEIKLSK